MTPLREIEVRRGDKSLEGVPRKIYRKNRQHRRMGRAAENASAKRKQPGVGKMPNQAATRLPQRDQAEKNSVPKRIPTRSRARPSRFRERTRKWSLHRFIRCKSERRNLRFFDEMGLRLAEGTDIETRWYCFELEYAADHPARNMTGHVYVPIGRETSPNPNFHREIVRVESAAASDSA